ncbi:MAG: hypothetical protein J6N20_11935, partial [Pseudomonas sp.]|nr:hypothetical protein [Pseudomonas sp.]
MTTYNTGNPVPSADARDRYDNSQTLDEVVNGDSESYTARTGKQVISLGGMNSRFNNAQNEREAEFNLSQDEKQEAFQSFLDGTGWSSLGAYGAGASITSHTQTVDYQGQPYQLNPSIPASLDAPYITTGVWATEGVNFKLVGDNSLRQDLALTGDAMIGITANDAKTGKLNELLNQGGQFSVTGQFPRILKYSTGPVSTSALKVVAGSTSEALTTSRLQGYLTDGVDIYFEPSASEYAVEAQLSTGKIGQIVCGDGFNSKIRQRADGETLLMAQHDNVNFRDLHLIPSNVRTSTFKGHGAYAFGVKRPIFERLWTSEGRSGGLGFANVTGGIVRHTRHLQSAVNPDTDMVNATGHDIILQRSCVDCYILDVYSVSGIGTTVSIQPGTTTAELSTGNVLEDIRSYKQTVYGIMLYTNDQSIQSILGTQVLNPQIHDVSGKPMSNITSNRPFGAGLFMQGAEGTDIYGGHITKTNMFTDNETLAPGGIGVLNMRGFRVFGTIIEDANYHAMHVSCRPEFGDPKGLGFVSGVVGRRSGKSGLNIAQHKNMMVLESEFTENTGSGVLSRNTLGETSKLIVNNSKLLRNGQSGLSTSEVIDYLEINNTSAIGNNAHGVSSKALTTIVRGGELKSSILNDGLDISADVLRGSVSGAEISGNGRYGVRNASAGFRVEQSANVEGNTLANFAGLLDNNSLRTLSDAAAPSVAGGDNFKTGGATAITSFSNGMRTQEITVFVQHTITILGEA